MSRKSSELDTVTPFEHINSGENSDLIQDDDFNNQEDNNKNGIPPINP
jgi:hypothetical protein